MTRHSGEEEDRRWVVDGRPPERLTAGGVELRRLVAGDAGELVGSVNESLAHLRPWMPWAQEPQALADQEAFVHRVTLLWEDGADFSYAMRDASDDKLIGVISLTARCGPNALEIGYWVHAERTRRGFASDSSRALTTTGFGLPGVERLEIHCDEANVASAAVPRKLGYHLDRIEVDGVQSPGDSGRSLIWTIDRASWLARGTS